MTIAAKRCTKALALWLNCALLLSGHGVRAQPISPTITDSSIKACFHHTSWVGNGAPSGIWAISQTRDGWLWLGSFSGLYRFDGDRFERVELRPRADTSPRSAVALFVSREGDRWISHFFGETDRLHDGKVDSAFRPPALPNADTIASFKENGAGVVWATSTAANLYRIEGGKWVLIGDDWGLPVGKTDNAAIDGAGTRWIATEEPGLYSLPVGAHKFTRSTAWAQADAKLMTDAQGNLWSASAGKLRAVTAAGQFAGRSVLREGTHDDGQILTRDGSWWGVECDNGICRIASPAVFGAANADAVKPSAFARSDGLSSDSAMTIFEDQENNVWVGTKAGLDQFRANELVNVMFSGLLGLFFFGPR